MVERYRVVFALQHLEHQFRVCFGAFRFRERAHVDERLELIRRPKMLPVEEFSSCRLMFIDPTPEPGDPSCKVCEIPRVCLALFGGERISILKLTRDWDGRAVDASEILLDASVLHSAWSMDRIVVRDRGNVLRGVAPEHTGRSVEHPDATVATEACLVRLREMMMKLGRHDSFNDGGGLGLPTRRAARAPYGEE